MELVCRNFMNHKCERSDCKFIHDKSLCYYFWKNGSCKWGDECRKNHFISEQTQLPPQQQTQKQSHSKPKRVKNTETFEPNYNPPDMRLLVECGKKNCEAKLQTQDVLLVPDFFPNTGDIYEKLVDEVLKCGKDTIKRWHENCHWIGDDKTGFKEKCPTFQKVLKRISEYFGVALSATRFNWYEDDNDWKAFHRDRAALYTDAQTKQNFTIAISFGKTRDAAFQDMETKKVLSIPCPDGSAYCFTRDINVNFMHGILPIPPEKRTGQGRISIIVWTWRNQDEVK